MFAKDVGPFEHLLVAGQRETVRLATRYDAEHVFLAAVQFQVRFETAEIFERNDGLFLAFVRDRVHLVLVEDHAETIWREGNAIERRGRRRNRMANLLQARLFVRRRIATSTRRD